MNELLRNIGLMSLATISAGAACCGVAFAAVGAGAVLPVLGAVLVSFPVGAVVLSVFRVRGVEPSAIVLGTLLRVGLSMGAAGLLAAVFEELRTPVYFLAVAVVYLGNLFVETWLVFREHQRSVVSSVKVVRPLAGS